MSIKSLIEKLTPYMRDRSPKHYDSAKRSGELPEIERILARAVQGYVDQRMPNDDEMGGLAGEQRERFLASEIEKYERDGILCMLGEIDATMKAVKITAKPKPVPRKKKRRKVAKRVARKQQMAA